MDVTTQPDGAREVGCFVTASVAESLTPGAARQLAAALLDAAERGWPRSHGWSASARPRPTERLRPQIVRKSPRATARPPRSEEAVWMVSWAKSPARSPRMLASCSLRT